MASIENRSPSAITLEVIAHAPAGNLPADEDITPSEEGWRALEAILQGNPVATFVIDATHKVTHWNRACELITGVPSARIIGTSDQWKGFYPAPRPVLADLIVAGEVEKALANYEAGHCQRSLVVDGAYEAEGYFPLAGGDGRWLFFTAAPLRDAAGNIVGAIETLQDITARRAAENALQEEHDNLEKLVEQRTTELLEAKRALELDIQRRQLVEDELLQRNNELLDLAEQRNQLEQRVSFASTTAMTAMSSMGEMGVLLQALQHYNGCQSFAAIAQAMIGSLASYDLTGVVQIRTADDSLQATTGGVLSQHDSAVFAGLRNMGRIVHFRSRMIINYDHVSLLIHNVPQEDTEKTGRIKDNLAILVEAADVRIAALMAESGSVSRQEAILTTVEKISGVLSLIERKQQESLTASSMATHNMLRELEKLFVHLGLTPRQEDMLLEMINASIEQISNAQSGQQDFQKELAEIIHQLAAFSQ
ncbi:MAG: PAS domain-containing protein [Bacteroidota bacterium]